MGYRQKHTYIAQIGYMMRYEVKRGIERLAWMFKVKDCRHICLFCEYYETCKTEENTEKERRNRNEHS